MTNNETLLKCYRDSYMSRFVAYHKLGLSDEDAYSLSLNYVIDFFSLSYYFDRDLIDYLKGVRVVKYSEN